MILAQLSGCATAPKLELLALDAAAKAEISDVPFFSQRKQQCGAASLATVLAYHGEPVSAVELEDSVYLPGKEGAVTIEVTAQARRFGMVPYPLEGSLPSLLQEIHAGNPVIVLQNLGLSWLPQWHFAVVIGYDLKQGIIILRSGNIRRKQVAIKTFYSTWKRSGFWGLVVSPPFTIPVSAQPLPYLKAVTDLEQVGKTAVAQTAYVSALNRWQDKTHTEAIRVGLSNLAYRRGDLQKAKTWLLQNISQQSATAITWNNLAYVMQDMECPQASVQAVDCAVQLANEPKTIFEASKQEIYGLAAEKNRDVSQQKMSRCLIPSCAP